MSGLANSKYATAPSTEEAPSSPSVSIPTSATAPTAAHAVTTPAISTTSTPASSTCSTAFLRLTPEDAPAKPTPRVVHQGDGLMASRFATMEVEDIASTPTVKEEGKVITPTTSPSLVNESVVAKTTDSVPQASAGDITSFSRSSWLPGPEGHGGPGGPGDFILCDNQVPTALPQSVIKGFSLLTSEYAASPSAALDQDIDSPAKYASSITVEHSNGKSS